MTGWPTPWMRFTIMVLEILKCLSLFQQAYSGNTADVSTYVQQWQHLIDLMDDRSFLYVGDCKLAAIDNMAHIHDNQGLFLSPAPRYSTYEDALEKALQNHTQETLRDFERIEF